MILATLAGALILIAIVVGIFVRRVVFPIVWMIILFTYIAWISTKG